MSDPHQAEDQGGAVKSTAVGCLGILCAMVVYVLTIGVADMLYASTGLPALDETGALGMILGIGLGLDRLRDCGGAGHPL